MSSNGRKEESEAVRSLRAWLPTILVVVSAAAGFAVVRAQLHDHINMPSHPSADTRMDAVERETAILSHTMLSVSSRLDTIQLNVASIGVLDNEIGHIREDIRENKDNVKTMLQAMSEQKTMIEELLGRRLHD